MYFILFLYAYWSGECKVSALPVWSRSKALILIQCQNMMYERMLSGIWVQKHNFILGQSDKEQGF